MNRPLALSALLASLLLAACATTQTPPAELVAARDAVRFAQGDPGVQRLAPTELKKAVDTLGRANGLNDKGESMTEIRSVAYVATQQARAAVAIARAKTDDAAIAGAELERERIRADSRGAEARRAQAQAATAQAQASTAQAQASTARAQTSEARQQTAAAEQRASGAERQTAVAQASAADAQQQAAQLQQRLDELQARKTDRGMLVTLGDVLFETNQSTVRPSAQASLQKLAQFLGQYPSRRILIEGHTDNVGSAASNENLSRRRADAVDSALMALGVARQRVATVGYGEEFPVADNASATNRALNRRVEVYIADGDQAVRPRR